MASIDAEVCPSPEDEYEHVQAQQIALNVLRVDMRLQPRVDMDEDHIAVLSRVYANPEPPEVPAAIWVFLVAGIYYVVDGFHRFQAKWRIRQQGTGVRFTHIRCRVVEGETWAKAIEFAMTVNLKHMGKPMGPADRKNALMKILDVPGWIDQSCTALGKKFKLSTTTIQRYVLEYATKNGIELSDKVVNSDGRISARSNARLGRNKNFSISPAITGQSKREERKSNRRRKFLKKFWWASNRAKHRENEIEREGE